MRIDWNTRVPMRDGTELSADIWHNKDGERRTTLLARTPYNKNTALQQARAEAYAQDGYNFVWMDVRGRGDSPVREALLELASAGLVEAVPNKGYRVVELSQHDLDEILEVRHMRSWPTTSSTPAASGPERRNNRR